MSEQALPSGEGQPSLFDEGTEPSPEVLAPRPRFPVRVIRSAKRRRTAHAQLVDGEIVVRIPARMTKADEVSYVAELVERIEKREHRTELDLDARTKELARRFDLPLPASIRFVDNQRSRWGSCTIESREIRVVAARIAHPHREVRRAAHLPDRQQPQPQRGSEHCQPGSERQAVRDVVERRRDRGRATLARRAVSKGT